MSYKNGKIENGFLWEPGTVLATLSAIEELTGKAFSDNPVIEFEGLKLLITTIEIENVFSNTRTGKVLSSRKVDCSVTTPGMKLTAFCKVIESEKGYSLIVTDCTVVAPYIRYI